ncbi:hypothetical protein SARC_05153 [Sphaeroforma arctica JP610]|uniref:Uncharacterized protein n=1 Tax=Sphaeroforma arctica JP610 TaxID=667725 RepID=A0A0L0G0B8_9EUKA|nr:hypothetical protein SARC_05153 [Sphaeroforma arctica JP610]KNC82557.1 hypothetical protein SARC_05153 [Sphaeroforma arctica JP610]|eukprot:XP_014156459.1 hypothetical protein SARC_05153 [Sphaeroforma arctica JP610]
MRLMRKIVSSGKPDADDGPKPANRSSISSIHSTSKKSSLVPPKQKQAEETTVPGEASVILAEPSRMSV